VRLHASNLTNGAKMVHRSTEEYTTVIQNNYSDDFGREVVIREYKENNSLTNGRNGLAGKGQYAKELITILNTSKSETEILERAAEALHFVTR